MFAPLQRLEDGLFRKSRTMGPPWGPTLRLLRYPVAIVRDWLAGELSVRAMSLAYTTLLSLVPLMVFSFSILKGLGASSDLRFILQEFFRPMGSAADQLTESVLQFVTNMRGDLLGAIGLAFLAYTVISTIQKVEASFNFVWQIARPRGLARRFTEYLTVMIVGPILLAVALELLAGAERSPVGQWLNSVARLGWILSTLGQLVPYAIVIIVFASMYAFIPNTRVRVRAALIGGVTAGVIWALVGKAFTTVIVYSSRLVAVYSGFAIVLTTLIWVYLSWLILLIGAQLAFYVQFPQRLRYGHQTRDLTGSSREQIGLTVMYLIGRDYHEGQNRWGAEELAAELDLPEAALASILASLRTAGLVVPIAEERFVPGRDAEAIELAAVFEAVRNSAAGAALIAGRPAAPVARVMAEVEAGVREKLGHRSLKDLIQAV
jgi:membrane protein